MDDVVEVDVLVVGGGLAGLAAGAAARAAGASALVLEAHGIGGRAKVAEKEGFTLNLGAHALYVGSTGIGVLRSLGIEPTGAKPPLERYQVSLGDRVAPLPGTAGKLVRSPLLGVKEKAKVGALLGGLGRMDPATFVGRSLDALIAERGLEGVAEQVVRAAFRIGTYASDTADLDAGAAVEQLQRGTKPGVIYLDGGWAQLYDGLATKVEVQDHVAVRSLEPAAGRVEVVTDRGRFVAGTVVLAAGTPAACRALLPDGAAPAWDGVGAPVTAACLDLGLRRVPDPGYVLGLDEPVYATLQGPPARQAPDGMAVLGVLRYGARSAELDRPVLEAQARRAGVREEDVVVRRFLASMVVAGGQPRACEGGLAGRPTATSTGIPGVLVAGDWVGPDGLLADASLSSGAEAARLAVQRAARIAA